MVFSFSGGTLARDVNILKETSRKNKVPLKLINNIIRSNSLREKNIINLIKKKIPKRKKHSNFTNWHYLQKRYKYFKKIISP